MLKFVDIFVICFAVFVRRNAYECWNLCKSKDFFLQILRSHQCLHLNCLWIIKLNYKSPKRESFWPSSFHNDDNNNNIRIIVINFDLLNIRKENSFSFSSENGVSSPTIQIKCKSNELKIKREWFVPPKACLVFRIKRMIK